MSTTYGLFCEQCKKQHWAGQSQRLYCTASRFLQDHIGHHIQYLPHGGESDDQMGYAEVEYQEDSQ